MKLKRSSDSSSEFVNIFDNLILYSLRMIILNRNRILIHYKGREKIRNYFQKIWISLSLPLICGLVG